MDKRFSIQTIVLLLLLTIVHGLYGQRYHEFPTANVQWNVYFEYSVQEHPTDTVLLRYVLEGDTTINEVNYVRLCLKSSEDEAAVLTPVGGLREAEQKVYYIGDDFMGYPSGEELVLYDFGKQAGDTVFHSRAYFSIIESIDSVEINQHYRKRFKISATSRNSNYYFPNEEYWIEGIGSIKSGLLGHVTAIPTCCYQYWEHVCFKENDILVYLNPNFNACEPGFLSHNNTIAEHPSKIKVYPNPFTQKLIIENTEGENFRLRLIDRSGRVVVEQTLIGTTTILDLTIAPNVYFVQICKDDGTLVLTQKMIKQIE